MEEKTSVELGKVQPLLDAKKWDEATGLLTTLLASTKPGSYDQVVVSAVLAQVYLQKGTKADFAASIPLLDRAIDSGFYDTARISDFVFLVGQLWLQLDNPDKAEAYAKRYLDLVPKPPVDRIVFHASLVMSRAQKSATIDPKLAEDVLAEVERGLHMTLKPTEPLLVLKAVALQALDRFDEAAEVLELLIKLFPNSKQYWGQLFALYVNNQRDLPAILTIERAQAAGLMNTPKDNIALISLYYNMENYQKAIALLEKGLRDGSVPSEPRNWELLAFAFQRTHRVEKSIDVYKEATKIFPGGKFDAQISNLYFGLDKMPEAFTHAKLALDKGDIERPEQLATFAAFLGYELKRYTEALEILEKAKPFLKTDRDRDEYNRLRKAVEDALRAFVPAG